MSTGKSKKDFPGSFIPFDISVGPVPAVSIDSSPTSQICVSNEWLPFVVGCLKALARPETWSDTYDHSVVAASEFAALIGNIGDGCGVVVPSKGCFSGSFADDRYGFEPTPGAPCAANWDAGVGWEMCCDSAPKGWLYLTRDFGSVTLIRAMSLVFTVTAPYLVDISVKLFHDGDYTEIYNNSAVTGPTIVMDVTGLSEPASAVFIYVNETFAGCAADVVISDFSICYTGSFPLSVPPDNFTHVFNFLLDDGGFTTQTHPDYPNTGTWLSATGWVTDTNLSGGNDSEVLQMHRTSSGFLMTHITIDWTAGADAGGGFRELKLFRSGTLVTSLVLNSGAGTFSETLDPFAEIDEIQVVPTTFHLGGLVAGNTVTKITVSGLGTDPY